MKMAKTPRNGAFIYGLLEGSITERIVFGGGVIGYNFHGHFMAEVHKTINTENVFSIKVHGVKWRLAPNDSRRLICPHGMWMCNYVQGEQQARESMMEAIDKRLRIREGRNVILPMSPKTW